LSKDPFSAILKTVEVHLTIETEKKLKDLSAQSGRGTDDLVEDAMAAYLREVVAVREMLDSRYDDLKSGGVKPIPGDEVEAYFREKSAAARRTPVRLMTGCERERGPAL
jgi:predicted DNA-binding protein